MAAVRPRPRRGGPAFGPPLRGRADSGPARALLLLAAGLLAACGGEDRSRSVPAAPGPARRVVSLAPSHTELLFALGAGEAVVGVDRFSDRPEAARGLPVVGDATGVNLEAVAALDPDLVVVNAEATREALAPLASRVPILDAPTDTLPALLDAVGTLGRAVGREEEGRALRASMERALSEARARNAGRPPTRVLFVVQRDPFFVAGGGSYVDALLEVLGCRNAAGDLDAPWPGVSLEAILERAPDAVVDASFADGGGGVPDDGAVRRYWARFPDLPAVRAGRVRALAGVAAVRPGPALDAALRALEDSLVPAPSSDGKEGR